MPKKRNFLGGMQNYNPNNGEYESALVGPNGKVAKDVDGDGKEHESQKQPNKYDEIFDEDYQRSYGPEKFLDEDDEEVLKSIISKAKELGDENILENAQDRLDELQQEKTNKSFSKFGKTKEEDAASTFDKINAKRMGYELPKESKKPELLSKEYLDSFYEKADGDEDKMLDLIRADEEYQNSFDDPNTTWSMGDLQGIIEAYMDKKTGKNMIERYREKLSKNRLPF